MLLEVLHRLVDRVALEPFAALAYVRARTSGFNESVGLSALTVSLLKAEGLLFGWLPEARGMVLGIAAVWSLWLGARMIRLLVPRVLPLSGILAFGALCAAVAGIVLPWVFLFYLW